MSLIPIRPGQPFGTQPERSDAARNRERLLQAARDLVAEHGVDAVTMDMLACRADVGKGTVFRRFGSRAGLMMTLLSDAEAEFQREFIFGPPPLGPGAPPLERLIAFGEARIKYVEEYGELARAAAEHSPQNRHDAPPVVLWHRHIEMLLREAGLDRDPWLLALSLGATLDPERILHFLRAHGVAPARVAASWRELVTRLLKDC
ncbi:TetR/AcrR family transcriptional regulator [Arthrobacter bambusae]|uniref:TetR/AcrR family transcriptional regulator n=1 Tax=Arthrobacter bambusae TaxID=1338426 RepID=UPI002789AB29|nr:TetR/AcrR family transcriptional regulator [Arthrobacter bambusae]MDQ0030011.1 AcrR family transcriptional regulator [Arthrobacter bambusae]MDQ0097471.1 AcrR family transcriptional regulator [Arthrobacter bambusae]